MNDRKVCILSMGGTILGKGESGRETGYKSGVMSAYDILSEKVGTENSSNIIVREICNKNSDDITFVDLLCLTRTINEMSKSDDILGFVVLHGTDTLEETAYFLNLTVKTEKPVVVTGSMRPSTSLSSDGQLNLYNAIAVAKSSKSKNRGVTAVFADRIFYARNVTKSSTYLPTAVCGGETGVCGIVRDGNVYYYNKNEKRHTVSSEFDVEIIDKMPRVAIVYFYIGADASVLPLIAKGNDGIVIAGAGAGEFSLEFKEQIEKLDIPVVVSSRTGDGIVTRENLLSEKCISADNLNPQKARILLTLALTKTKKPSEIQRFFDEY